MPIAQTALAHAHGGLAAGIHSNQPNGLSAKKLQADAVERWDCVFWVGEDHVGSLDHGTRHRRRHILTMLRTQFLVLFLPLYCQPRLFLLAHLCLLRCLGQEAAVHRRSRPSSTSRLALRLSAQRVGARPAPKTLISAPSPLTRH